ncbi:hypothetical protein PPROV_001005000 [Pycnococcus provasolii]|uniref:Myb-like domain-containing protein n=1 Tax=Pycnococcus provasolii TaxID=41880 RepID=A0A830HVZ7_9CHLO|nr:hypothetical protein PPROV_001005000 [Pycnococcus provasolii]|mmetsp:Transcript_14696/g.38939  ORF Transcript_14696/g.38939 Transcript_14696/m.38939 type:complete len:366 (-) Transcript_14696:1154-2251(-)
MGRTAANASAAETAPAPPKKRGREESDAAPPPPPAKKGKGKAPAPPPPVPENKYADLKEKKVSLEVENTLNGKIIKLEVAPSTNVLELKKELSKIAKVDVEKLMLYTLDGETRIELDERAPEDGPAAGSNGGVIVAYKGMLLEGTNSISLSSLSAREADARKSGKRAMAVPVMNAAFYEALEMKVPSNAPKSKAPKAKKVPKEKKEKKPKADGEDKKSNTYSPWEQDETQVIVDYLVKFGMHHGCWAAITKEIGNDEKDEPKRTGTQVKDRWRTLILAADRKGPEGKGKMRNPVPEKMLQSVRDIRETHGNATPRTAAKLKKGESVTTGGGKKSKASAAVPPPPSAPVPPPDVAVAAIEDDQPAS